MIGFALSIGTDAGARGVANTVVSVQLSGEFAKPGRYQIRQGETMSAAIARAGGLTDDAYPLGAVFTRRSQMAEDKRFFEGVAGRLELALVDAIASEKVGPKAVGFAEGLIKQLRSTTPFGRIVVEADPTVLQVRPRLDIALEDGDRLVMPKRPNWVAVSGAVRKPLSLPFQPRGKVLHYIRQAGGFSKDADKGGVFVIYPDGRAQETRSSFWNYQPVQLVPGSRVVVPVKSRPYKFLPFLQDQSQLVARMAINAASLAAAGGN